MLILEGFQAGLSWITILRKRAAFRAAFAGFEPAIVAGWGAREVDALMRDRGIVRHRGKIVSTIGNAQAWLAVEDEIAGGFSGYMWSFVDGTPLRNRPERPADIPTRTDLSLRISRDLKRRGFRFCGPTTVYAFLQAAGLVNDHLTGCFRHEPIAAMGAGERTCRPRH